MRVESLVFQRFRVMTVVLWGVVTGCLFVRECTRTVHTRRGRCIGMGENGARTPPLIGGVYAEEG